METTFEITRAVSMLRSAVRVDIEACLEAIDSAEAERACTVVLDLRDKLKRVINVLNGLR